jgi:hypothetical protein
MATITLGRDCTFTAGEHSAGVRSVIATETTQEIEVRPYGSREIFSYTTGYSVEVQVETIDGDFVDAAVAACEAGDEIEVSGTGFAFTAVVTNVTNSQPLDDVCSYAITFKRTGNYR